MKEKPKRRWFVFSIRDLAWLTVLCAVLAAWWLDRGSLKKDVERVDNLRRRVSAEAEVVKIELDKAIEAKRNVDGTVTDWEIQRLKRRYAEAKSFAEVAENVDQ